MDYTVHGILQARILEWLAFPFSRASSQPRDQTQVSHIAGRCFTIWATREDLKNLPSKAKDITDTGSILGWEDPLEEDIATHSSICLDRIAWTEELMDRRAWQGYSP